jgi:hypothetical protein
VVTGVVCVSGFSHKESRSPSDNLTMYTSLLTIGLFCAVTSLYVMRRRVRLGRRKPTF